MRDTKLKPAFRMAQLPLTEIRACDQISEFIMGRTPVAVPSGQRSTLFAEPWTIKLIDGTTSWKVRGETI
jgi:hypothetical protein